MFNFEWYVDKPGRRLDIVPPESRVWVDVEPGCFTKAEDVRNEGTRLTSLGMQYGTYGNKPSIEPVFGESEELNKWPLWYANYKPPLWTSFESFNGFYYPQKWQFCDEGLCGINVDLSLDNSGKLWADFGNYTILTPANAEILVLTCQGVIIGLQDEGIAQWNFETLKAAVSRIDRPVG